MAAGEGDLPFSGRLFFSPLLSLFLLLSSSSPLLLWFSLPSSPPYLVFVRWKLGFQICYFESSGASSPLCPPPELRLMVLFLNPPGVGLLPRCSGPFVFVFGFVFWVCAGDCLVFAAAKLMWVVLSGSSFAADGHYLKAYLRGGFVRQPGPVGLRFVACLSLVRLIGAAPPGHGGLLIVDEGLLVLVRAVWLGATISGYGIGPVCPLSVVVVGLVSIFFCSISFVFGPVYFWAPRWGLSFLY